MSLNRIETAGPAILELVKQSKKILLHLHPRPDGDSVGSALGSYHTLTAMGKEATVIKGDSDLPVYLSSLPGFERIIPKNIFEIDLEQFDLFIIQDSGALDRVSSIGEIILPPNLKTVCIDHHITTTEFAQVSLIDSTYPSTCEMLVELYTSWGVELTHDAAVCLFIGMYTDTGGFRYPSTTTRTFSFASKLSSIAPDFSQVLFEMDNHNTKGRVCYEGIALTSVRTFLNDHVAISVVSNETLEKSHISPIDAKSEIANKLKSVVGWYIGISMVEEVPGEIKVSARTRNSEDFDVSKIAEALGGGGHKAAAGFVLKMPLEIAVTTVVETIEKLYGTKLVV